VGNNEILTLQLRLASLFKPVVLERIVGVDMTSRAGRLLTLAFVGSLVSAQPAAAGFYPLELTNIKPIGAAPSGLDANNRIYRAYPNVEYNIRAAVVGGDYPFTFSLTNAPAGMTINANTGEISWPNPQANASPTITVRDAAGAQRSATWPITVTTSGFVFLDAVNGRNASNNGCSSSCGTGTAANPWRTIRDMYLNAPGTAIAYFRSGTYNGLDLPRVEAGGYWERVEFSESTRPVIWVAYPGHAPRIDFGYQAGVENAPLIRLGGSNVYVDGFETLRSRIIGFQVSHHNARGSTFRRMNMHDTGPGVDGSNAAFIMYTQNYPVQAYGVVIQDSTFCGVTGHGTTVKTYSMEKVLIENTTHCNARVALELKSDTSQFTVRGNTFRNMISSNNEAALGGNMHMVNDQSYGEILFNNVINPNGTAMNINQDGQAREVYVHRNTFVGQVRVNNTDSADGPFTLTNNIIVNSVSGTPAGSHITHNNVSVPQRINQSGNLAGYPTDGIVDANGNLTLAYAVNIGTRGHMLGAAGPAPTAPQNVRIVTGN
jgi:hypothetical protein